MEERVNMMHCQKDSTWCHFEDRGREPLDAFGKDRKIGSPLGPSERKAALLAQLDSSSETVLDS